MNLNSSNSQDLDLRQAVEDQLDLILKIEEERKALKKQNKMLQQKLKQLGLCMQKYQRQAISASTNTDSIEWQQQQDKKDAQINKENKNIMNVQFQETGVQINMQAVNNSTIMNCSKLSEARSLLKVLDEYESKNENIEANGQMRKNPRANSKKQKSGEKQKINKQQHGSQLALQMMKLTKQLNLTKKQLKQMQHKYKLRQKQLKQLKKCLQNKSEALQKSRKQFNELSILMNLDKYKSIRNLQQQIHSLKSKLLNQQDNTKIKHMLTQVTQQYEDYRKSMENKIDILVAELANKEKQIENLEGQRKVWKSKS